MSEMGASDLRGALGSDVTNSVFPYKYSRQAGKSTAGGSGANCVLRKLAKSFYFAIALPFFTVPPPPALMCST